MKELRTFQHLTLAALCLCAALCMTGCRGKCDRDGGLLSGLGRVLGGGRWSNDGTLSPGPGAPTSDNTPLWGGSNTPRSASPTLTPLGGGSPITFSADAQATLQKYNTQVTGADLTQDRLQLVLNALQLYRERQHPLTVIVEMDSSRLPITAMWSYRGSDAKIELFQPDLQHTIAHEVAHDMTLLAYEAEGEQFDYAIRQAAGMDSTWPSGYSQSGIDDNPPSYHEPMAEILSFLAEAWAQLPSDEMPFTSFSPTTEIRETAKFFVAENVRANAR
jgi:hypothetical protein